MIDQTQDGDTDDLLFRCLEGIASDAEYEQAWRWVNRSSQNMAYYTKIRDTWMAAGLLKTVDTRRQRQVWLQIGKKKQPEKIRSRIIRISYLKWAAAAAVVVFAYLFGLLTAGKPKQTEVTTEANMYLIEAPKGGKSVMTLSDGSKVWLNAGSALQFDQTFGLQNRNLTLHGEAYFEVAHDDEFPFHVETSGITITALGTAFNVKAYPEDDLIETTLVEGSVRIETNAQSKTKTEPVVLEPNQKVVFYKKQPSASVPANADMLPADAQKSNNAQSFSKIELSTEVDVELSTSWKDKRWMVVGEPLGVFAANIERKYDMALVFEDPELEDYKISATLEEETIEQLFNAIRLTVPMDYLIERNRVYLKINQQLKKKYDRLIQNR